MAIAQDNTDIGSFYSSISNDGSGESHVSSTRRPPQLLYLEPQFPLSESPLILAVLDPPPLLLTVVVSFGARDLAAGLLLRPSFPRSLSVGSMLPRPFLSRRLDQTDRSFGSP